MKLIYLNAELDSNKEHELFKITPNGFRVLVEFNENSLHYQSGTKTRELSNVTEVHHDFTCKLFGRNKDIAFESEILCEGFVWKIAHIDRVTISLM